MQDWEQTTTAAEEREESLDQGDAPFDPSDATPESLANDADGPPADAAELPQLRAEYRRLVAPLGALAKIKAADPRVLERLDAALKRLPPGDTLGQTLDQLRERT